MKTYERGAQIGPYEIVNLLPSGAGGMAAVYLARPRPGYAGPPLVALKVAYGTHNDFLKNEIDHLQQMDHPNILRALPLPTATTGRNRQFYNAKVEPNNPSSAYYSAVEYMRGGSIEDLIRLRGKMRPDEAVEIASQVAGALDHIHSRQVAHLDIKASNVLLREPLSRWSSIVPHVIVADFGISSRMGRNQFEKILGTQAYTAPERAAGELPTAQNDIFSLGSLLYEMLTGRVPFDTMVIPGTPLSDRLRPSVLNPAVSSALEQVVLRAIATDPRQRYHTAHQLKQALDSVPGIRRPTRIKLPLLQGSRDYMLTGLIGAAVLLLLAIVLAVAPIANVEGGTPTSAPAATSAPAQADVSTSTVGPTSTPVPSSVPAPTEEPAAPIGPRPTSTIVATAVPPTEAPTDVVAVEEVAPAAPAPAAPAPVQQVPVEPAAEEPLPPPEEPPPPAQPAEPFIVPAQPRPADPAPFVPIERNANSSDSNDDDDDDDEGDNRPDNDGGGSKNGGS